MSAERLLRAALVGARMGDKGPSTDDAILRDVSAYVRVVDGKGPDSRISGVVKGVGELVLTAGVNPTFAYRVEGQVQVEALGGAWLAREIRRIFGIPQPQRDKTVDVLAEPVPFADYVGTPPDLSRNPSEDGRMPAADLETWFREAMGQLTTGAQP